MAYSDANMANQEAIVSHLLQLLFHSDCAIVYYIGVLNNWI